MLSLGFCCRTECGSAGLVLCSRQACDLGTRWRALSGPATVTALPLSGFLKMSLFYDLHLLHQSSPLSPLPELCVWFDFGNQCPTQDQEKDSKEAWGHTRWQGPGPGCATLAKGLALRPGPLQLAGNKGGFLCCQELGAERREDVEPTGLGTETSLGSLCPVCPSACLPVPPLAGMPLSPVLVRPPQANRQI